MEWDILDEWAILKEFEEAFCSNLIEEAHMEALWYVFKQAAGDLGHLRSNRHQICAGDRYDSLTMLLKALLERGVDFSHSAFDPMGRECALRIL